jgi:CrcB protein
VQRVLLVLVGGGLGSVARYLFGGWVASRFGSAFPYGTIAINAIGSFLIVVIMYLGLQAKLISPDLRLALTTGVMGGFTTYSTFNYETLQLLERGAVLLAVLNVTVTVVLCFLMGIAALFMSRALIGS